MRKKQEKGFVLVVGLVILLIMTLLTLYGTSNSLIQEKISGNTQDQNMAFQTAEQALRTAEEYIFENINTTSNFNINCNGGLCLPNVNTPVWEKIDWETNNDNILTIGNTINGVYKQPKFIIELLDNAPLTPGETIKNTNNSIKGLTYRVTVLAWGSRSGSKVMIQSIYIKR